jgi:hypothetical protein
MRYETRAPLVFITVRMQREQTSKRTSWPSNTMRFRWTFGLKSRFVRRLEWLTLCPKLLVFPQIMQWATAGLPPGLLIQIYRHLGRCGCPRGPPGGIEGRRPRWGLGGRRHNNNLCYHGRHDPTTADRMSRASGEYARASFMIAVFSSLKPMQFASLVIRTIGVAPVPIADDGQRGPVPLACSYPSHQERMAPTTSGRSTP